MVKLLYEAVYDKLQTVDKTTRNYLAYQNILENLNRCLKLESDYKMIPCIVSADLKEIIF